MFLSGTVSIQKSHSMNLIRMWKYNEWLSKQRFLKSRQKSVVDIIFLFEFSPGLSFVFKWIVNKNYQNNVFFLFFLLNNKTKNSGWFEVLR